MKIVTVVGARPQFIKAAVVSRAIAASNQSGGSTIDELIIHTGQHYDHNMSQLFFDQLAIPKPALNLGIGSASHGRQTAEMLIQIESVLTEHQPDWLLIYGDTNSTLAGALAAAKLGIPVAHVEAGLRSFNMRMPEEINRILADQVSARLFCPTQTAVDNLRREGVADQRIELVGDVMYDAAIFYGKAVDQGGGAVAAEGLGATPFVLATIHRAENTDDPVRMNAIVEGLEQLAGAGHTVVLPLHPRTKARCEQLGVLERLQSAVRMVAPLGFLEMIELERAAICILTDSGGVQKEAFFHRTPCVTLRDETEWVETVDMGCNRLVCPLTPTAMVEGVNDASQSAFPQVASPYGDGNSGSAIIESLLSSRE